MAGPAAFGADTPRPRRALRLAELLTLSDQTDEHGRLLLEDSASKQAQKRATRSGVAMREMRCDYADSPSRLGGRMNVSAYEALRRDVGEVLDGFDWLARLQHAGSSTAGRGTLGGLIDVANLGSTLPLVLFRRVDGQVPAHGALPAFIASIFKASRGLFSGAVAMLNDGRDPAVPVSTADVMAFAEGHGQFRRRETQRVCAAPARLIARTIEAILTGEGTHAGRSRLDEHVDGAQLRRFFELHDSFSQALSSYRHALDTLSAQHPGTAVDQLYGAVVTVGERRGTFADLTAALGYQGDQTQAALNEVLGRSGEAPPLTLPALLQML